LRYKIFQHFAFYILIFKFSEALMPITNRDDIYPGLKVAITLKQDQGTDILTEGVVADILTNSSEHPRGIKVRLDKIGVYFKQV
jgi:uncharacterized repeat protein (TIGR03833 family)